MPDAHAYVLFVAAALALLLVPGPAVVYVVARSVSGGASRASTRRSAARQEVGSGSAVEASDGPEAT